MTQFGVRLRDLPYRYGWDALEILVDHAPMDSAFNRWLHKGEAEFSSDLKQSAILADIFDCINRVNYSLSCIFSKQKPREPKRYPRPWLEDDSEQRIGSAPIAIADFNSWYYE